MDTETKWGDLVRVARMSRGWTQEQLAAEAGISRSSVQSAEAASSESDVGLRVSRRLTKLLRLGGEWIELGPRIKKSMAWLLKHKITLEKVVERVNLRNPPQKLTVKLLDDYLNDRPGTMDAELIVLLHTVTDNFVDQLEYMVEKRDEALREGRPWEEAIKLAVAADDARRPDFYHAQGSGRPYITTDADASRADPAAIKHNIPVRSLAAAGPGTDHQDRIFADRYLPSALVPHPEWSLGAFEVTGDSMEPYLSAGDVVIIGERLQNVRTDDICIFGFKNGEHTMKKLRVVDAETWDLIALNSKYGTMRVKVEELAWWVPVLGRWEPIWRRRQIPWEKDV